MIITIGGIKGGTGKSTIAVNLACYLAEQKKKKVLLIDADDQATTTDFTNMRANTKEDTGFTCVQLQQESVRTQVTKLYENYDFVVIDTGGRDTTSQRAALTISNILILPFAPRSFDVWTLEQASDLIGQVAVINENLSALAFLNRADPQSRGADNGAARDAIEKYDNIGFIDAPVGSRKAIGDSTALGLSIFEHKPKNKKAVEEMTVLFDKVLK